VERLLPGLPARGAAITLVSARRSARAEEERDAAEQRRREQVELEERAGIRPDDDALTRTRKLQDLLARERAQPAR
jgi:hypothetical protein